MAKVTFKFGTGIVLARKLTPTIQRGIAFLDKTPFGQLYDSREFSIHVGCSSSYFRKEGIHPALRDYRATIGIESELSGKRNEKTFWGSKKTIAAYRKENP